MRDDHEWQRMFIQIGHRTTVASVYGERGVLLSWQRHYEPETPESLAELRRGLTKVRAW